MDKRDISHLDFIVSEKVVREWIGVSRSTLQRWRARPDFPKPVKMGPSKIGYMKSDIVAWMNSLQAVGVPENKNG